MTRFLSALRRFSDNDLAQDVCAGAVTCLFILAAGYGLAGVSTMVAAARALP